VAATLQAESMQKVNNLKGTNKKLKNSLKRGEKTLKDADISFVKKFSISELQEIENKRNDMVLNCQGVENQLNTAVNTISRLKDNIEKYEKNTTCEHCNKKPRVIWEQLESDKTELEKAYKTRDTLMKKLTKLNKEIDDYHIPIKSSDFELIENLKTIETEIKVIKKQIRNQQTISRKHSVEMEEAQKKYDLMRFWEQAFSEQGLIKYIIRNILEFFNTRSNYYLNILSKGVFSIEFDEILTEYISNGLGEVSFDTLSGGEKKKVSLAVMLSLNDLLRLSGKDKSNIIFFDEVADSLDKEGVKGLCELIDELKEDKKVFIISHNEHLTSIIEDEATELVVKKKQGTTSFA
jgi:DNA repair exonuclease SbcCD ATPase subunit